MADSDGFQEFYAEIHTPESIRLTYAPEGNCLGCNAKLSRYRTMTGGEWDKWCSPCQLKGTFELQCESCWQTFPSFGTRTICSKCLVPSHRKQREEQAREKASEAWYLYLQNVSIEKIADKLEYHSVIEAQRALNRLTELMEASLV